MQNNSHLAKPFIKWAGGKTQLLSDIERSLPPYFDTTITTYVEPFVGGGSVMFRILQKYKNIKHAVINDINLKLINVYRIIKHHPQALIIELQKLQDTYLPLSQEDRATMYLEKRSRFNELC